MTTTPVINDIPLENGCYIAGQWGQYIPDMLADLAETFGWRAVHWDDDPRQIRAIVNGDIDPAADITVAHSDLWDTYHCATDAILEWLNDHTTPNHYTWDWYDGEIWLLHDDYREEYL